MLTVAALNPSKEGSDSPPAGCQRLRALRTSPAGPRDSHGGSDFSSGYSRLGGGDRAFHS